MSTRRTEPLIQLRGIQRQYQVGDVQVRALDGVSLAIEAGDFVAIMGPSGSGKTTLMNILGCLDHATAGEYYFRGFPIHKAPPNQLAQFRRNAFGFVFQSYNLLGMASAQENVEVPAIYAGVGKRERTARAKALLSRFGLADRLSHVPSKLSGGEQQRVAIARALMNGGEVVLADEPTGSLDSGTGQKIIRQLKMLAELGHTIILVTHDPSVGKCANRRIRLLDGRIVSDTSASPGFASESGAASTSYPRPRGKSLKGSLTSLSETLRFASQALRCNRLRTALTLLGIIIGVFSVTAMLGVAEGVNRAILANFDALGGASLTVVPSRRQLGTATTLSLDDVEAVRAQIPHLRSIEPQMRSNGTLVTPAKKQFATIVATTSRAMSVGDKKIAHGVSFGPTQNEQMDPVVVLGATVANAMFGNGGNSIGEILLVNGVPFQVVGVLQRPESELAAFNVDANSAFVPLLTGSVRLFDRDSIDAVDILVAEAAQVKQAQEEIDALLTLRHGKRDFEIHNRAEAIEAQNATANILRLLFGTIGGISLLVAGIGVMNIMLATVAERTHEIGLRMATGARQRDILFQFICEAVIVSGIGGLVGIVVVLAFGKLINGLGAVQVAFSVPIVLTGLFCATFTGLVFGFAPARRAARMDPVTALARQ